MIRGIEVVGDYLDELARAFASGVSRRRTLRRFASAVAGAALASVLPGALAQGKEYEINGTIDCGQRSGRHCHIGDTLFMWTDSIGGGMKRVEVDVSWVKDNLWSLDQDDPACLLVVDQPGGGLQAVSVVELCDLAGTVNRGLSTGSNKAPEQPKPKNEPDEPPPTSSPTSTPSGTPTSTSGCQRETCSSLGKQCGKWPDGFGRTVNCGGCARGFDCNCNGTCHTESRPTFVFCGEGEDATCCRTERCCPESGVCCSSGPCGSATPFGMNGTGDDFCEEICLDECESHADCLGSLECFTVSGVPALGYPFQACCDEDFLVNGGPKFLDGLVVCDRSFTDEDCLFNDSNDP